MMHANFSWGYMHGMFFVFLMTLIVMVRNIREWWKSWKVMLRRGRDRGILLPSGVWCEFPDVCRPGQRSGGILVKMI